MTLRGTVQVNSEDIGAIAVLQKLKSFFNDIHQSSINPILNLLPQVQVCGTYWLH